ncbi:MAG: OadG family protein [Clostridia bacterium]|nr:OadG family protein [Clostridia bacterium]
MKITPQLLGIFTNIYGSYEAMTISRALMIALVGFMTVLVILAIIALFIKLIAFIFSAIEKKNEKKIETIITPVEHGNATAPSVGVTLPETESQGELELIGVDEPTAAMLMALVSYKTEIPLNRLAFRSIKLVEDK